MRIRNFFKTLFVVAIGLGMAACGKAAKPVHELKSSFAGDFGDINVTLNLNDDKTACAQYEDPFNDMKLADIGNGTWTWENDTKNVSSCKIGGQALDVDAEHGLLTMYLKIGDNNGTATIEACASTGSYQWAVSFKFDTTKPDPVKNEDSFATFKVTKDANATAVHIYDFVLGDYSTLAVEVEKVNTKNFLAVKVDCADGFEVDTVKLDGVDPSTVQNSYYCFGGLQAKEYTITVTTKAAA